MSNAQTNAVLGSRPGNLVFNARISNLWNSLQEKYGERIYTVSFEEPLPSVDVHKVSESIGNLLQEMVGDPIFYREEGIPGAISEATAVFRKGSNVVWFILNEGWIELSVWSVNHGWGRAIAAEIQQSLPRLEAETSDQVEIRFWRYVQTSMGSGPRADTRLINCYEWTDIHQNYPAKVKKALGTLWGLERPFELGKIILWHGTAGTGKTSALQAFLRSLSDRNFACDYIVDPEDFFDHVGYGYEVLLSSQDENEGRIICLEDAGHLFTSAGRSRPGFSRLLNLTDGLIGQGLKTMFLITTNDPIEKIDPAVRRSGRCIQALEFTELSSDEASIWLERHGIQTEVSEPQTLADLYQLQNAIQNPMDKHFRRQLSPE